MIIGLPLLFAYYIKADLKKVFNIKMPKVRHLIGAVVLWIGGYILVSISSQILLNMFPQNMEVVENLNHALYEDKFLINLFVVALMPAICEEMLFRGFIFTSFTGKKNYKMAIIGSAILFGFMHIDFIRIIPTAILGVILAYAVYKTGSIFVAMLIHFINNGLVVLMMHYPKNNIVNVIEHLNIYSPNFDIGRFAILIVLSVILLVISSLLLKNNIKDDKEKIVNIY